MKHRVLTMGVAGFAVLLTVSASQASFFDRAALTGLNHKPLLVAASNSDEIAKGAESFVDGLAQQGIGFLSDASLSNEKRKQEFETLLHGKFDLNTIGRFTLGRYWRSANEAQRSEYMKLFKAMIVEVYSRRFGEYNGQSLVVEGSRPEGDSDVLVHSVIRQQSGPDVKVDWRVRKKGSSYKVIDVVVEGVSMAVTQRSEFSSVIQRGGGNVQVLIDHLHQQVQP